ncbi:MAG: elongation factor G [Candidatus Omnitrophota bacterium]|nr:MAG: elongation factor G [Candidatus Omnitrophota bacterium]
MEKRNIVLLSHSGAGKTSLAEAMLFDSKEISRLGKVETGDTVSDYTPEEIERRMSLNLSLLHCHWKNKKINILDTPGYADFIGEIISGLVAADAGVLIVDASAGIEVGTERAYQLLNDYRLPFFIFVNKLDKEGADFLKTVKVIQDRFGKGCFPVHYPINRGGEIRRVISVLQEEEENLEETEREKVEEFRKKAIEMIAEVDDYLLERYLEEETFSHNQIMQGLQKGFAERKLTPILCGSALRNIGIDSLLEMLSEVSPSPPSSYKGVNPESKQEEERKADSHSPFSALVFKTISDPYVGQLSLFKVFSGELASNTEFYNSSKGTKERISQILFLQGKEQKPTSKVEAGDIAAVAKLKNTETGDSICEEKNPILFSRIDFPQPLLSLALKPKSNKDEAKISEALVKLHKETPTFHISRDEQTKELLISGMGNLCLEIAIARLKREFKLEVEVGEPKIAYKETITRSAEVQGKYKRQTGGHGQYGDVWLRLEPLERGKGFEFVNKIVGGVVPRQYIPAVEKGIKQAMSEGVLAGYPLVDIKATLYDGSYHSVDSSDLAFQIAAAMALRKGALEAKPVLLEPIVEVEVDAPEEYMGDINSGLSSKRGRIVGMEGRKIKALVPLSEMTHYTTDLKSITGGRGSFSMKFSHYEIVPQKIAEKIIAQKRVDNEKEK